MRKCVPEQRTRDYNWKKYKIQAFKVEHKFNPNPSSWIFPKGLAYDFWSKFPNSLKFVSCQIGPGNDVWWCSTEVGRSSWPYFEMSILGSHHLGFFPKGLAYEFWSKFQISLKLCIVKLDQEMMFGDVLQRWEGYLDHIWRCPISEPASFDFLVLFWCLSNIKICICSKILLFSFFTQIKN